MSSAFAVTVKERETGTVAFIAVKGPFTQVGPAFGTLYAWIEQHRLTPSGPPSGLYFDAPGQVAVEEMRWELRSPIAGDVGEMGPDEQGLGVKRVGACLVASTIHRGPYDQLGRTYEALGSWIAQNGYQIVGPAEDVYLTDPAEVAPEDTLTEILFPVRKLQ